MPSKEETTETEYGFVSGPCGVARKKTSTMLTTSEKARLMRISASPTNPTAAKSAKAWNGYRES